MPTKVLFRVIHVSGQDENHKAVELNAHSPTTKGWQSNRYTTNHTSYLTIRTHRFCLYPQDIVIRLEKRSRLRKLQILSHQNLIGMLFIICYIYILCSFNMCNSSTAKLYTAMNNCSYKNRILCWWCTWRHTWKSAERKIYAIRVLLSCFMFSELICFRYVALSDNEKTAYKARELKSVHVDAMGVFIKFVIHKNHVNRHNLYNQV